MKKDSDLPDENGEPYCYRKVVECPDEPIAGEWLAVLECGHRQSFPDLSHAGAGAPIGGRCEKCEEEARVSNEEEAAVRKAEQFCHERGIYPGFKITDSTSGPSVFSRIGGTGLLICHPEEEPDMQSSWAMTPENFAKRYLGGS